jgi:xyloglucan:xyloglucosyl transferase
MASFLWTVCLSFLLLATVTKGASPKKVVDVPFGRNYVPTWAFDHIKYINGGSEIQLKLDKFTGAMQVIFFFFMVDCTHFFCY